MMLNVLAQFPAADLEPTLPAWAGTVAAIVGVLLLFIGGVLALLKRKGK